MKTLKILEKKDIIGICAIAAVIAIVLVCLLPWPTQVQVSLHAVELAEDNSAKSTGNIVIKGWKLNYLFTTDKLRFQQLQVLDKTLSNEGDYILVYTREISDHDCISGFVWSNIDRQVVNVDMCLHKEGNQCYIELDDDRYVGSIEETVDIQSILNIVP